jgi:protein-tyrosine phosphatase
MCEAARRRGFPTAGRARKVTAADLDRFDWILVMDRENLADVELLAGSHGRGKARIALFCDFCENHADREVPDPYYGGPEGFDKVLDLLEDGCESIVRKFRAGEL